MYAARCNNYLEDEDRPCDGIILYREADLDAPCTSCGGRCGWMVADYFPGQSRKSWITRPIEEVEYALLHDCRNHGCDPPHGDSPVLLERVERPTHASINTVPALILQRTVTYSEWEPVDD